LASWVILLASGASEHGCETLGEGRLACAHQLAPLTVTDMRIMVVLAEFPSSVPSGMQGARRM